jgi:hypothetical protein
LSSIVG